MSTASAFAFFDVDETLINLKSMFSFRAFYLRRRWGPLLGWWAERSARRRLLQQVQAGMDRTHINSLYYAAFKGHRLDQLEAAAQSWFEQVVKREDFYIQPVLQALRHHKAQGVEPVFVSGSSDLILGPLAVALGVSHLLSNRQEVHLGRFTGALLLPQTIGVGKRQVVETFIARHGADPLACYAYGDHYSDLPMLEAVGHPVVVAQDSELIEVAQARRWTVMQTGRAH